MRRSKFGLMLSFIGLLFFVVSAHGAAVPSTDQFPATSAKVVKTSSFTGSASGASTLTEGACTNSSCGNLFCFCWSLDSLALKAQAFGKSTISLNLNGAVTNSVSADSATIHLPGSGTGSISTASGDQLNLELNGSISSKNDSTNFYQALTNFTIVGGTGKFASATGVGTLTMGGPSDPGSTKNVTLSISGILSK